MKEYLNLLSKIKKEGILKEDRTGIGVQGVFGAQMRFDLQKGFPLVTTKKTFLRGILVELIWLLRGETNIKYLVDRNVKIWDEWPFQNYLEKNNLAEKFPKYSDEWHEEKKKFIEKIKNLPENNEFVVKWGDLGPVYGHQWRNFSGGKIVGAWIENISEREWGFPGGVSKIAKKTGIDQIKKVIETIKNNPTDRRMIVSAWSPAQFAQMLLPPCHAFFQFNVDTTNGKLNLQMYQRSADTFLGVPFNIASYSILLMLIAKITGYEAGEFIHTFGDAHIYKNHFEQVDLQLSREPFPLPELKILKDVKTLEDLENLEWEDFELVNYQCHDRIVGEVAV
ncbi:thymidylate synthase [Candidatus Gracilibacteria bacterium]|nr:thymidylate synthase [Candidatus Gracilibacteria bacterium]